MKRLFAQALSAKALALLFVLAPLAEASTDSVVYWTFSQTSGPVLNTQPSHGQSNSSMHQNHSGWIGYSRANSDDGEVVRDGTLAKFNGQRNSIVFVDDANHTDLNPGDGSFIVTTRFAVDQSVLEDDALGLNQTWNLVQKGRYNNSGGQWKLQIRKNHAGRIFLQCLFNDNNADAEKETTQVRLKKTWIEADHILEGQCTLDRLANRLSVDLTNTTLNIPLKPKTAELRNSFATVAPQAGECGSPNAFGGNVTIGNKPLCPKQKLDTDDAFRGKVYSVRIQRF